MMRWLSRKAPAGQIRMKLIGGQAMGTWRVVGPEPLSPWEPHDNGAAWAAKRFEVLNGSKAAALREYPLVSRDEPYVPRHLKKDA